MYVHIVELGRACQQIVNNNELVSTLGANRLHCHYNN
jgi:hypothetical protein